jgi:hypothetical protein
MARRRLPRMVFDFCDGAAEDEITRARSAINPPRCSASVSRCR